MGQSCTQLVIICFMLLTLTEAFLLYFTGKRVPIASVKTVSTTTISKDYNDYVPRMKFTLNVATSTKITTVQDFEAVKITNLEDISEVSELCMNVFFGSSIDIVKRIILGKLRKSYTEELVRRFFSPSSALYKAVDRKSGKILGFAEIYISESEVDFLKGAGDNRNKEEVAGSRDYLIGLDEVENPPVKFLKIANFAVSSQARRKGVGSALLKQCFAQARLWGYSEVVLLVDEDNKDALRFYTAAGFEEIGKDGTGWRYEWRGWRMMPITLPKIVLRRQLSMTP